MRPHQEVGVPFGSTVPSRGVGLGVVMPTSTLEARGLTGMEIGLGWWEIHQVGPGLERSRFEDPMFRSYDVLCYVFVMFLYA